MSPLLYFAVLYLTAVVAGALGALLGLGGGVLLVPALTLAFGLDIREAIGASIVSVVATSSGAAATYVKERLTNLRLGMFLESATTTGAVVGAVAAGLIGGPALFFIFAVVMVYAAAMMFRRSRVMSESPTQPDALARRLRLSSQYDDAAEGRSIAYGVTGVPLGYALALAAGGVSGLLGIGGGVIKVPAMNLVMRVPLKVASATSDLMIGVTAATGAAIYFARGDINPFLAAPVAMGVLCGTVVGTRLMARLPSARLQVIFALVLVVVAVEMMLRGFGVR